MKTFINLTLTGLFLVCLFSCKKTPSVPKSTSNGTTDTTGTTGTTDTTKTLQTDVYYVGFINKTQVGTNRAEFWKNGVLAPLSNVASGASNIWVSKGNTYVCGYESVIPSSPLAVYWKNFSYSVPLTNGSEYRSIANDITVQDSDVLCVGNVIDKTGNKAVFWRNRQMTVLSIGGGATRILVKGSDVYIAGNYVDAKGNSFACYWKNGVVHNLTARAQATGIAIDDNSNIYLCGTLNNSPVYWKNDVMTALPYTTNWAFANAITTKGNDVYIVGSGEDDPYFGYDKAYYWKNGIPQDIAGGSEANNIAVVGTHVFITGSHIAPPNTARYARLWDNASIAYLEPDGLTSVFNGLYINQHY